MTDHIPREPEPPLAKLLWLFLSIFSAAPIAILYGVITRLAFGGVLGLQLPSAISERLSTLSVAFLFLVPFAIGVLTVAFAGQWRTSWLYALAMPVVTCLLWARVIALFLWEAFVCVLMALPIVLPLAVVGGLVTCAMFRGWQTIRSRNYVLALFVILPYLVAPIEALFPVQDSLHRVESQIIVKADAETVWGNMVRVPEIDDDERDFRWFHFVGVPWPRQAMLSQDGPDGVRYAQYEGLLSFSEPITDWRPYETFSFDIKVNDPAKLPMPLSEIGGKHFDILKGTFVIEPMGAGQVRLRLISEHRLTTRFNTYGGVWTEILMADFQNYVLSVIKTRSEAGR